MPAKLSMPKGHGRPLAAFRSVILSTPRWSLQASHPLLLSDIGKIEFVCLGVCPHPVKSTIKAAGHADDAAPWPQTDQPRPLRRSLCACPRRISRALWSPDLPRFEFCSLAYWRTQRNHCALLRPDCLLTRILFADLGTMETYGAS